MSDAPTHITIDQIERTVEQAVAAATKDLITRGEVQSMIAAAVQHHTTRQQVQQIVDDKFATLSQQLASINAVLSGIQGKLDAFIQQRTERIETVERSVSVLQTDVRTLDDKIDDRVEAVSKTVDHVAHEQVNLYHAIHGDVNQRDGPPSLFSMLNQMTMQLSTVAANVTDTQSRLLRIEQRQDAWKKRLKEAFDFLANNKGKAGGVALGAGSLIALAIEFLRGILQ